jgi:hypothetical protein
VYEVEPEGEISPEQDELGQPTGFRCSRARIVSRVQIPSYRSRHVLGARCSIVISGCWTTRHR